MTQQQKIFIITSQGLKPVQLYRVYNCETIETPEPVEYVETGTPGSTTKLTKLQKIFHIHPCLSRPAPQKQYLTINQKKDESWPSLRLKPSTYINSQVEWERSLEDDPSLKDNQIFDTLAESKETNELKESQESPELILRQFIPITDDIDVNIPDHKIEGNTLVIWNNQSTIYKCYDYDIYGKHLVNEFRVAYTEPISITNSAFQNTETQLMLTKTVTPNDFIELSVSVPDFSATATYTWYERVFLSQPFTPITNKSSKAITIKDVPMREGYSYYCEIDNNGFKYKSDVVTLHYLATQLIKTKSDSSSTDRVTISFDSSSPTTGLVFTCQIPTSTTPGASWYYKDDKSHSSSGALPQSYSNLKANLLDRYQYVITNKTNNRWTFIENCNLIPATITDQPSNVTVNEGVLAAFTVTAEFAREYEWQYQWPEWRDADTWLKCGTSTFSGGNGPTLQFKADKVNLSRNGYRVRCKITGTGGTIIYTEPAELIVTEIPPLKITQSPQSVTIRDTETALFTVVAEGAKAYKWQYSKNGGTKWFDTTMEGYTTDTLIVPAKASGATVTRNGYMYRCIVTGYNGETAISEAATLTVTKT